MEELILDIIERPPDEKGRDGDLGDRTICRLSCSTVASDSASLALWGDMLTLFSYATTVVTITKQPPELGT